MVWSVGRFTLRGPRTVCAVISVNWNALKGLSMLTPSGVSPSLFHGRFYLLGMPHTVDKEGDGGDEAIIYLQCDLPCNNSFRDAY